MCQNILLFIIDGGSFMKIDMKTNGSTGKDTQFSNIFWIEFCWNVLLNLHSAPSFSQVYKRNVVCLRCAAHQTHSVLLLLCKRKVCFYYKIKYLHRMQTQYETWRMKIYLKRMHVYQSVKKSEQKCQRKDGIINVREYRSILLT